MAEIANDKLRDSLTEILHWADKELKESDTWPKHCLLWDSVVRLYDIISCKKPRIIGVYGCPNMGKSTLINSIVKVDILPRSILSCTGAVIDLKRDAKAAGYEVRTYKDGRPDYSFKSQDVAKIREHLIKVATQKDPVERVVVTGAFPEALPFFNNDCTLRDTPGAITGEAANANLERDSAKTIRAIDWNILPLFCVNSKKIGANADVDFYRAYFEDRLCVHVLTCADDARSENRETLRNFFIHHFPSIPADEHNPKPIIFTGMLDPKKDHFISQESLKELAATLENILSQKEIGLILRHCCEDIERLFFEENANEPKPLGWYVPRTVLETLRRRLHPQQTN